MAPKKVLFVCLGNICRSPSAEGIFTKLVTDRNLSHLFEIDSAGTAGYHVGGKADARMRSHALKRDVELTSLARQLTAQDLHDFDSILAMDESNMADILSLDPQKTSHHKIHMMTNFCTIFTHTEVPDPYYGGDAGFELVLDILDDACTGLLDSLLSQK